MLRLNPDSTPLPQTPTADEYGYGAGTRQGFQGSYMTWDPTNDAIVH